MGGWASDLRTYLFTFENLTFSSQHYQSLTFSSQDSLSHLIGAFEEGVVWVEEGWEKERLQCKEVNQGEPRYNEPIEWMNRGRTPL